MSDSSTVPSTSVGTAAASSKLKATASAFVPSFLPSSTVNAPAFTPKAQPFIPGTAPSSVSATSAAPFTPPVYDGPPQFYLHDYNNRVPHFIDYSSYGPIFDDETVPEKDEGRNVYSIAFLSQLGDEYVDKPDCVPNILDPDHPDCMTFCHRQMPAPKRNVNSRRMNSSHNGNPMPTPQKSKPAPPTPAAKKRSAAEDRASERARERDRLRRYEKYDTELNQQDKSGGVDFTGAGSMEEMIARLNSASNGGGGHGHGHGHSHHGHKGRDSHHGRDGRGKRSNKHQKPHEIPTLEELGDLHRAEDRFVPSSQRKPTAAEAKLKEARDAADEARRIALKTVISHMNKVTVDNFDAISIKVLKAAVEIQDLLSLRQIVRVVFEKAVGEQKFAPMYAKLCVVMDKGFDPAQPKRKLLSASKRPKAPVVDHPLIMPTFADPASNTSTFQESFRTCMLREVYKQLAGEPTETLPQGSQPAFAPKEHHDSKDRYGLRKQRVRGIIVFMGELFKRGLLPWNIVYMCLTMLLDNAGEEGSIDDDDIEHVTVLLNSVGKSFDHLLRSHSNKKSKKSSSLSSSKAIPSVAITPIKLNTPTPVSTPSTALPLANRPIPTSAPPAASTSASTLSSPSTTLPTGSSGIFQAFRAIELTPDIDAAPSLGMGVSNLSLSELPNIDMDPSVLDFNSSADTHALPGLDMGAAGSNLGSSSLDQQAFRPIPLGQTAPLLSITVADADAMNSPALVASVEPAGASQESFVSDSPLLRAWQRKRTENKPVFVSRESPLLLAASPDSKTPSNLVTPTKGNTLGDVSPLCQSRASSANASPLVSVPCVSSSRSLQTETENSSSSLSPAALALSPSLAFPRPRQPRTLDELSAALTHYYSLLSGLTGPDSGLQTRQRCLLQDVLDLRSNQWTAKRHDTIVFDDKKKGGRRGGNREPIEQPKQQGLADNGDIRTNVSTTVFRKTTPISTSTPVKSASAPKTTPSPHTAPKHSPSPSRTPARVSRTMSTFAALQEEEEDEDDEAGATEILLDPRQAPVKLQRASFVAVAEDDEDEDDEDTQASDADDAETDPVVVAAARQQLLQRLLTPVPAVQGLIGEMLRSGDAHEALQCVAEMLVKSAALHTAGTRSSEAEWVTVECLWSKLQLQAIAYHACLAVCSSASLTKLPLLLKLFASLTTDALRKAAVQEAKTRNMSVTDALVDSWILHESDLQAVLLRLGGETMDLVYDHPKIYLLFAQMVYDFAPLVNTKELIRTFLSYNDTAAQSAVSELSSAMSSALSSLQSGAIQPSALTTLLGATVSQAAYIPHIDCGVRVSGKEVILIEYDEFMSSGVVKALRKATANVCLYQCDEDKIEESGYLTVLREMVPHADDATIEAVRTQMK